MEQKAGAACISTILLKHTLILQILVQTIWQIQVDWHNSKHSVLYSEQKLVDNKKIIKYQATSFWIKIITKTKSIRHNGDTVYISATKHLLLNTSQNSSYLTSEVMYITWAKLSCKQSCSIKDAKYTCI